MTPEEVREALETHLMGQGVYVTDCERRDGTLHVGYETVAPGDAVPHQEVGQVLNLLLDLAGVEGEERESRNVDAAGAWTPEDVHVWVFDEPDEDAAASADDDTPDRDQRGDWEVKERWVAAYDDGYLTETDLSALVLSTL